MSETQSSGMLGSVTGKFQPGPRPSAPESHVKQFTSSPYSKSLFAGGALGGIPKNFTTSDGRPGNRRPNLSFWTTPPPPRPFPSEGIGQSGRGLAPEEPVRTADPTRFRPVGACGVIVEAVDHLVTPGPALEFAELAGAQSLVLDDDCGHLGAFQSCSGTDMTVAISAFLARDD